LRDVHADYRTESRRSWGAVAEAWETHAPQVRRHFMPVTARMLDEARLQPGRRVLELACGTGEVGLMAHELIQPGGELLLSDFAPEMLNVAQRNAEAAGARHVRFKQIDIASIDVEAGTQDVVLCRWGLMFLLDPGAGLRECRRVLRPGGRLVTATWTRAEENEWSSVVTPVLVELGHAAPPDPDLPGQFSLADPARLRALLEDAGFVEEIAVAPVDLVVEETFEEWWSRTAEMSRAGDVVRGLGASERARVREALRERLARHAAGDGRLRIPGRALVASATA
jgi:SAM-dependent methyltransferase